MIRKKEKSDKGLAEIDAGCCDVGRNKKRKRGQKTYGKRRDSGRETACVGRQVPRVVRARVEGMRGRDRGRRVRRKGRGGRVGEYAPKCSAYTTR